MGIKYLAVILTFQIAILLFIIKYYTYVFSQYAKRTKEKAMGKVYQVGTLGAFEKKRKKITFQKMGDNNPITIK